MADSVTITAGPIPGLGTTPPLQSATGATGTLPSLASQVNARVGASIPAAVLAKLQAQKFNTRNIVSPYFRCLLYGEIDTRKTTTAAKFGTPENTRIVLVRQKEQLAPLRSLGYDAFFAETMEQLRYVLLYPEAIWPEWAKLPDRTLILDDITQAKDMLVEDNEFVATDGGELREVKDNRKVHAGAKGDLRELFQGSLLKKPMNIIVIALERSYEVGKETKIGPDLPPGMNIMLGADMEYIFNIRKNPSIILTVDDREAYQKKDDKGKPDTFFVNRFARHKIDSALAGKGLIKPKEQPDLRAIWEKVKGAGAVGVAK